MRTIIQLNNVTVGYDKGARILHDLNFSIQTGDFIGIIGKNGAGKSTLLKSMRGFLTLDTGEVLLAGRNVREYTQRELARKIAYLQQQVELTFDYTVRDMVMAGRYPYKKWWQRQDGEDERIIGACMRYTDVLAMANRPIRALSGGQRQRVLLAKVLAQQTPVLFLDEPAAGLDLFYQEEIFRFCRELSLRGKTVVMVVHELNLADRYCNRLMLLKGGNILADGNPAEVLTDELLSAGYGTAIRATRNDKTGHADIYTEKLPLTSAKKQLLDTIIGTSAEASKGGES